MKKQNPETIIQNIQSPEPSEGHSYTSPEEAVNLLTELYSTNVRFLREAFRNFWDWCLSGDGSLRSKKIQTRLKHNLN